MICEFFLLPKSKSKKDGRKPVFKPHDVLIRFGGASSNPVGTADLQRYWVVDGTPITPIIWDSRDH